MAAKTDDHLIHYHELHRLWGKAVVWLVQVFESTDGSAGDISFLVLTDDPAEVPDHEFAFDVARRAAGSSSARIEGVYSIAQIATEEDAAAGRGCLLDHIHDQRAGRG